MYKIDDFSTLTHVPVKTLPYCNEIGLLKPAEHHPLHCPRPVRQDDETCVTDIQMPVEKAEEPIP